MLNYRVGAMIHLPHDAHAGVYPQAVGQAGSSLRP